MELFIDEDKKYFRRNRPFKQDVVRDPWRKVPDIPELNAKAYEAIIEELEDLSFEIESKVQDQDYDCSARRVLLIGKAGMGKSHLLMKVAQNQDYPNYFAYIARSYDENSVAFDIFQQMISSLNQSTPNIPDNGTQLDDLLAHVFSRILIEQLQEETKDVDKKQQWIRKLEESPYNLFELIGDSRTATKFKPALTFKIQNYLAERDPEIDLNIVEKLCSYCFYIEQTNKTAILSWLRGQPLREQLAKLLGLEKTWWDTSYESMVEDSPQIREKPALRAIRTIGILTSYYRPLVLAFDQLEGLKSGGMSLTAAWEDRYRQILDETPNLLMVVCMLPELWEGWFTQVLEESALQRIAPPSETFYMEELTLKTAEKLLVRHLECLHIEKELPTPLYPFSSNDLEELCHYSIIPRLFIEKAREKYKDWLHNGGSSHKTATEKVKSSVTPIGQPSNVEEEKSLENFLLEEVAKHYRTFTFVFDDDGDFLDSDVRSLHANKLLSLLRSFLEEFTERFFPETEFKELTHEFKIPQNLAMSSKGGTQVALALCYESISSFTTRVGNLYLYLQRVKSDLRVVLLRDERCMSLSEAGRGKRDKIREFGHFVPVDKEEYALLFALMETCKAVKRDLVIFGEREVSHKEYFSFLYNSGILGVSQTLKYLITELGWKEIELTEPELFLKIPLASEEEVDMTPEEEAQETEELEDEELEVKYEKKYGDKEEQDSLEESSVPGSPLVSSPLSTGRLGLPKGNLEFFEEAARVVEKEYRASIKWKYLHCKKVMEVGQDEYRTLYELELSGYPEFEWTWEGSTAFCPKHFDGKLFEDYLQDSQSSIVWQGSVVGVDEVEKKIYIASGDPEKPPVEDSRFVVRPFEFLANLNRIFNDSSFYNLRKPLASLLGASKGSIHPEVCEESALSTRIFRDLWQNSWGILWGPPGTGKTYNLAEQVASLLKDSDEKFLIVSSTNKATDTAAIHIGKHLKKLGLSKYLRRVIRVGSGADYGKFKGVEEILDGSETEIRRKIGQLMAEYNAAKDERARATIKNKIEILKMELPNSSFKAFSSPSYKAVITTAFNAVQLITNREIKDSIENGEPPFTTVFIDEVGIMSRVTSSTLALLASRRVVLVGDPLQLSPIVKISRVHEPKYRNWLAKSPLSHLRNASNKSPGLHLLTRQYRMHPDIRSVVSHYQYQGKLEDAFGSDEPLFNLPSEASELPRSIWYVLDREKDIENTSSIRYERGPGNKSYIRKGTITVLEKLFQHNSYLRESAGVFLSPFVAQTREVKKLFAQSDLKKWKAATIHSQQGAEYDFVIFDTVNAGRTCWESGEWQRLVNVALSRAKKQVILMATIEEMQQTFLSPLTSHFTPMTFNKVKKKKGRKRKLGQVFAWKQEDIDLFDQKPRAWEGDPVNLGEQLEYRQRLLPILSAQQQALCNYEMDDGPRLVRGVAGSGKTIVLAHWVSKTVLAFEEAQQEYQLLIVYGNASLMYLIKDKTEEVWNSNYFEEWGPFPWENVALKHIKGLLTEHLEEIGLSYRYEYEYGEAAAAYLEHQRPKEIYEALFIDEAQDMGHETLDFLISLVKPSVLDLQTVKAKKEKYQKDRSIKRTLIFYDNAQNLYGRKPPRWADFGLEMRGRSNIMKEAFRSTQPICEFALNVLDRCLKDADSSKGIESDPDHRKMFEKNDLIEKTQHQGQDWWSVNFNQVQGPLPVFKENFSTLQDQMRAIAEKIYYLVEKEKVPPSKIMVLYNGIENRIKKDLFGFLNQWDLRVEVKRRTDFYRSDKKTILASTPDSFKGYDAEVVIIAGVDTFVKSAEDKIFSEKLYVAMTRARSLLFIFGSQDRNNLTSIKLKRFIRECLECLSDKEDG